MTTQRESKRILSVTVKRMIDESPDTSHLGDYDDEPSDYAIVYVGEHAGEFEDQLDCACGSPRVMHEDDMPCIAGGGSCSCEEYNPEYPDKGNEYRFFNPYFENYRGSSEEEIRKYCLQDYERMRTLSNGDWCYIGIGAEAEIRITGDLVQTIRSGGLWGIESDSESSYFEEVEREKLSALKNELHALGFSKRAIAAAFRNVKNEND